MLQLAFSFCDPAPRPAPVAAPRYSKQQVADMLEQLFTNHYDGMLKNATKSLKGRAAEAEDVVMHSFYKVANHIQEIENQDALAKYWRVACTHRIIDLARHNKRLTMESLDVKQGWCAEGGEADGPEFELADESLQPVYSHMEAADVRSAVAEVLPTLSTDQHQVIDLYYMQGMNLEQIVQHTGVCKGTVKSRLHRGRENLGRPLSRLAVV